MFSVPKNGMERIFECFLFRELVHNEIPKFFLFQKWFGTEFRGFFSSENGLERNSEGFSRLKIVGKGIPRVFLSQEMVRNGIPRFFLPRNRRNSDGTAACSVLFHFPRNTFLSENGNPVYSFLKYKPFVCSIEPVAVWLESAVRTIGLRSRSLIPRVLNSPDLVEELWPQFANSCSLLLLMPVVDAFLLNKTFISVLLSRLHLNQQRKVY
jgi:hypothetical protein